VETTAAINLRAPEIDVYIHPGDISYANDHVRSKLEVSVFILQICFFHKKKKPLTYETWWQQWFSNVENATSQAPYMSAPGNHEVWCRCLEIDQTKEFQVFKRKFRYPGHSGFLKYISFVC
jgi:hypothetical protein